MNVFASDVEMVALDDKRLFSVSVNTVFGSIVAVVVMV